MKINSITSFNLLNKGQNTHMKLNKTALGILGAAGILAMAATGAVAQQVTFASASGFGGNTSTVFTYTGGQFGQFTTTSSATFLASSGSNVDPGAILTFQGFQADAQVTGTGTQNDPFKQALSGGSFSLKSGTTDLLDGTFTSGNLLSAFSSGSTASITNSVNGVTYTGGSYFAQSGLFNPGSFSVSMTSVAPAPTITNGYLDAFTAGGTSTFSASSAPAAVPEASTSVTFILGGLGLLALIVRKNRRASGAAA